MRIFSVMIALMVTLSACETPTQNTSAAPEAAPSNCSQQAQEAYQRRSKDIKTLEAKVARGYRTNSKVVKIADPLKLCKGIVPFVSVCLPTPTPKSTLPSYEDHKAMRAQLEALKTQQEAQRSCARRVS